MLAVWLLAAFFAYVGVTLAVNAVHLRRAHLTPDGAGGPAPTVSVLVPARNEERNLRRLVPTLLAQDFPRFEILVCDDGSEDGTAELLRAVRDPRLRAIHVDGPPAGWVGKVHALYRATREATGAVFLFLDADVALTSPQSLSRLVARFRALPEPSVLTGFGRFRGGGLSLISLVPFVILGYVPQPLVPRVRIRRVGGMNGQCWMIRSADYRRLEPHLVHQAEVLEDIRIGQYLHQHGVTPRLFDLQRDFEVWMYAGFRDAWLGFRKNVYPFMGGTPIEFGIGWILYAVPFVLAPLVSPWFVAAWYALKLASDRLVRMPWHVTALALVTFVLGSVQQIDSAIAHWRGRVRWKGRNLAAPTPPRARA
jgi:hypothetical protein